MKKIFYWTRKNLLLILGVAFCVALLYTILVSRSALVEMQLQLNRVKRIESALATSLWRYGTIESLDATRGTVTISIENRFYPDAGYLRVLAYVGNETIIAKQDLVSSGNVYTGLTAPEPSTFAALRPGTKVALLLENNSVRKAIEAKIILFGSPL